MCLAIPGKIIEFIDLENSIAKVEIGGVKRNINTALLDPTEIKIGDYVLIHVGFAMNKIDEQQAQETLKLLQELGEYEIDE
ncbi:MAG: HypC/HybG/HupF family hydrogenase formation chaperone [Blastocatellia bacterium]|nr:HypC/HybG/HupF family hydrogenase formation chaperone [Blastocatellia bacterium]MBL8197030.1 HypC/HybG/HupF family hydrogenase formation chaperone [Blastocatellia bacterium]MBN8722221.1 HypC/HybG/HupF family hydrogenase formation chaperone [Acidobacteriota bacterium]